MSTFRIMVGDALAQLRALPDKSVDTCITSPPYYGLRDYQTGSWVGGDPGCDHQPASTPAARGLSSSTLEGGLGSTAHLQEGFKAVCPRCGARRHDAQLGLEGTVEEFIENLVEVFREVRRVLKDHGTAWVNLGDSFVTPPPGNARPDHVRGALLDSRGNQHSTGAGLVKRQKASSDQKRKDLMGVPWRLALALQAGFSTCSGCGVERRSDLWPKHNGHRVCIDCLLAGRLDAKIKSSEPGWFLRRDIIWSKPNAMPESAKDRPATAHEYVFLLAKRSRYFYDHEAVKEPVAGTTHPRSAAGAAVSSASGGDGHRRRAGVGPKAQKAPAGWDQEKRSHGSIHQDGRTRPRQNPSFSASVVMAVSRRALRSVWTIPTRPFKGAHFATFPEKLVLPCILAGTSAKGCCSACGAPWLRIVQKGEPDLEHRKACGADVEGGYSGQATKDFESAGAQDASAVKARILAGMVHYVTVGWRPSCACGASVVPAVVIDPFSGSGTVGVVAVRQGRDFIGIELSPKYAEMGRRRVAAALPGPALFALEA